MGTLPLDVELKHMRLHELEFKSAVLKDHKNLLESCTRMVQKHLNDGEIPIRFVITSNKKNRYCCEVGVLADWSNNRLNQFGSIFHFIPRNAENTNQFNAVLLVPTGIGAEIGGHDGDAGPVARLLAPLCDNLITHPNVVNASDINEIPDNGLYVEGSEISKLLMGTIGLQPVRSNRILVIIDAHEEKTFVDDAINAVNAARATYGLNCVGVVQLDPPIRMSSKYTSTGRAVGEIESIDGMIEVLNSHRGKYDAIAISSVIEVPSNYHIDYYKSEGKMVNPWGGVEALLTHAISLMYDTPSAHSPMFESREIANLEVGVVDPRMAAEEISTSFFQSVLKGLKRSPKIISSSKGMKQPGVISVNDISCLIIPDGCIGLPTLAALEQGILVIAVRENRNIMQNDLTQLPWSEGQLNIVDNYWEAAGVMSAMKAGIEPASVRRPLKSVAVERISTREKHAESYDSAHNIDSDGKDKSQSILSSED